MLSDGSLTNEITRPRGACWQNFRHPAEPRAVDRRPLYECVVTHYAAVNAKAEQLDRLTHDLAESTDWSGYLPSGRAVPSAGGNGIRAGGGRRNDRRSLAHALPRRHSSRWRTRRSRLQTPRGEARAGGFWRWSCKQRHYSDCLRLECTPASKNLKKCHQTSGSAQESPNVD